LETSDHRLSITHLTALVALLFVDPFAMNADASSTKRVAEVLPQASYHIPKRSRLDLPEEQLKQLNATMNARAAKRHWSSCLQADPDDEDDENNDVLYGILYTVSTALRKTVLQDRIVAPGALPSADDLGEQSYKGKPEWKDLLKKVLDTQDWEEWIRHRTCDPCS
jgi:hypothetical protein